MVEKPLYEQIADKLRQKIKDGDPPVGGRFPGLETQHEEFGVAFNTVRTAYEILAKEGLIRTEAGRGVFVITKPGLFAGPEEKDEVVKRLRRDAAAAEGREREEGYQDGIAWAKGYASIEELKSLDELGSGNWLPDGHSIVDFQGAVSGQNVTNVDFDPDDPYWEGFLDGADEVWDSVRGEL